MKYIVGLLLTCIVASSINGQLIRTDPAFPSQLDDVTIYFDAKKGNAGLAGFEGDVYAHTGVITSTSSSPSDWKYVQGQWGVAFPKTKMTSEGDDIYSLAFNIGDYYEIPDGVTAEQLAFVFRNVDGSVTGRESDGGDIYTDLFPPQDGLLFTVSSPGILGEIIKEGDSLLIDLNLNKKAFLVVEDNGIEVFSDSAQVLSQYIFPETNGGHELTFTASFGEDQLVIGRSYYVLEEEEVIANPPAALDLGLNYYTDSSYIFTLLAPEKDHAFLLCPANNFQIDARFRLNKSEDLATFWIELPRTFFSSGMNTYQYLVDGNIRIADPFSTVVLDPNNDLFVPVDVLVELPAYPSGLTNGVVTAFQNEASDFAWSDDEFVKPAKTDLIIYELLMRDFLEDHNYKSLLDTLDYFQKLGVNAIELMPINEFEGNDSWGYNPSFHMALDKYYGSIDQFKMVVDQAHNRGIAVILDVVFNHVFSQSPLAQLYWDASNFRPAADNPWLNVTARHPFNVGYDVNHESNVSKRWVKRVCAYWMDEFHVDGFRFDLSKGFTQRNSGNNAGFMGQYDQGRIDILSDYADFIWSKDPSTYVIMEHFAENPEEKVLANAGMMLWGNNNHGFINAASGRSSNIAWMSYHERGWNDPHIVAYMESHDEERMMYEIVNSGSASGDYNTQDFTTALNRIEASAAIFYSVPGPKMLWQFGELGYDFSINTCVSGVVGDCRLDPKPIKWDYLEDADRKDLQVMVSDMMALKKNYPTFATTDFEIDDSSVASKVVRLHHEEMDAVVIANYRVVSGTVTPKFQSEGMWYEYFTGDSILVDDVEAALTFFPGEYRIYTSERISPPSGFSTSAKDLVEVNGELYPNPVTGDEYVYLDNSQLPTISDVILIDVAGQRSIVSFVQIDNGLQVQLPSGLQAGIYFLSMFSKEGQFTKKFTVID